MTSEKYSPPILPSRSDSPINVGSLKVLQKHKTIWCINMKLVTACLKYVVLLHDLLPGTKNVLA